MQTDTLGTVVWQAEYEPFGSVFTMRTGTRKDQRLRFPGQMAEDASPVEEESYNIFRWYRAGWGRYTQRDPLGGSW